MIYDVHIYREMRIPYRNIEVNTSEGAAEFCRDLPSSAGGTPVECDGQTFAAVVDSPDHPDGKDILFEEGRLRKHAQETLKALIAILPYAESEAASLDALKDCAEAEAEAEAAWEAVEAAQAIIAKATAP
jgi:hypothetical protein